MARYIDADLIKQKLKEKAINPATSFINTVLIGLIDGAPTADVAPKSEVLEEIENILDPIIQLTHAISVKQVDPIEREKAASAEKALRAFRDYIAVLKKKYEEGNR